MKALFEYIFEEIQSQSEFVIVEGRKQKVANWKKFSLENQSKNGRNTVEYFKYFADFLMFELMWKFPIKYKDTTTEDVKMGYSGIPAKAYTYVYELNNHEISIRFNAFFDSPFAYIKIDGQDVTNKLNDGSYGDMLIGALMCDKNKIALFASILEGLK